MVKALGIVVVLNLLVAGCGNSVDVDVQQIETDTEFVLLKLGSPNLYRPWSRFDELVKSVTNRAMRARCYAMRRKKLLAVELTGDDYEKLARVFSRVSLDVLPNSCVKEGYWTFEDECNASLDQLTWMRRQLDKWKAMVGAPSDKLNRDSPEKHAAWRNAYRLCLGSFESYLFMFENRFEDTRKSYRPSEEEYAHAKAKVERFLGHPVRSQEELRSSWHQKRLSDEMKAIK